MQPTAFRRFLAGLLAGLAIAGASLAQQPSGNALMIFDSYLAHAALTNPRYRTDLKRGGDPRTLPPGRLLGQSPVFGAFTYRPRTFAELNRGERTQLLSDPGFRAFLVAIRERSASENSAELSRVRLQSDTVISISVSPEEMLDPRPLSVAGTGP